MSHGPSLPPIIPPPPEPPPDGAPVTPAPPEPPAGPEPATFPLPPAAGPPPTPDPPPEPVLLCSSIVPDVGYSVLWGVTETLPPLAQYEYGVSAIATASVRLLPSVL